MANYVRIQIRRDTTENWKNNNPVLTLGELGADITAHKLKVGDGQRTWNNLPYVNDELYKGLESVVKMISGITGGGNMLDPVNTVSELITKYPNPSNGDIVYVASEKKFYTWNGSNWVPVVVESGGIDQSAVQSLIDQSMSTINSTIDSFGAMGMGYTVNTYNEYKKPTKITFSDGVVFTLTYNGGTQLNNISSSTGEVMTMIYDTDGTVKGRNIVKPS